MAPVFAQDPKIFRLIRQGTPQDVAAALAAGANSLLPNKAGQTALTQASANQSTRIFGHVLVQFLKAWEGRKDSLRACFETIHAQKGLSSANAARDHHKLNKLAKASAPMRFKPRPPAPPKG